MLCSTNRNFFCSDNLLRCCIRTLQLYQLCPLRPGYYEYLPAGRQAIQFLNCKGWAITFFGLLMLSPKLIVCIPAVGLSYIVEYSQHPCPTSVSRAGILSCSPARCSLWLQ